MNKHTPGPWIKPQSGEGFTICGPERRGIRGIICKIYSTCEDMEANARLIAAAPELLEACRKIVREENSLSTVRQVVMESARAAIAAAVGEADD